MGNQNSSLKPLHLLLVELAISDVNLVLSQLRCIGYEVTASRVKCEEALVALLSQQHFDIALVLIAEDNADLPLSRVLDLLNEKAPTLPRIILNDTARVTDASVAFKPGTNGYQRQSYLIQDPPQWLASTIEHELENSIIRRELIATQSKLNRREAELAEMQRLAHVGSWSRDIASGVVTWSDELWRIYGLEPQQSPTTFETYLGVVHPDDREYVRNVSQHAYESRRPHSYQCRIVRPDGSIRFLHMRGDFIVDGSGEPVRVVGTALDITEQKVAKESLEKSLSLLQATLDATTDGLLVVDQEGQIVSYNRKFLEMWRIPEHIIAPRSSSLTLDFALDQLVDSVAFLHKVREIYSHHDESYDLLHFKDGRIFERFSRPQRVGDRIKGRVWSFRDITARKQAEAKLQESEERYRRLVEYSPETIAVESQGKLVYINKAGVQLLGATSAEDLRGRDVLELIHPDYREVASARLQKIHEQGGIAEPLEEQFIRLDGTIIDVEVTGTSIGYKGKPASQAIIRDITARKRAQAAQQESEARYRRIVDTATEGIWLVNPDDRTEYVNNQMATMLGYKVEEMLGRPVLELINEGARAEVAHQLERHRQGHRKLSVVHHKRPDGSFLWARIASTSIMDEAGNYLGVLTMFTDITESKRFEEALIESNTILKATQDASADAICLVDDTGVMLSFNQRFANLWRIPSSIIEELRDQGQLMSYVLSNLKNPDEFIDKINYLFDHPNASSRDEIELIDGRVFERYSARALSPEGHSYGRVWSFSDVTERKQYEQKLAHQAFHDSLTTLPNRALFMDRLARGLARAARHNKLTAVLFLDLDRFKVINDSMGHDFGDLLLMQVAQRLQVLLRPSDTAARFGGDEFTILLEDITSINDATRVAERIAESLQAPFQLQGQEVHTGVSIGIVLSNSVHDRPEDLLRNADVAMYRAKNSGRGRYEVFDKEMSTSAMQRMKMEIELRQALKLQQLRLYYQPIVDLVTGRVSGFEALLRWQHPKLGLVPPGDFIPLAEETGIILPIGQWVLREACQQLRSWQEVLPNNILLEASVNLSARQFHEAELAANVARILKEASLDGNCLKLEITESVAMEDAQNTIMQLQAIKKLGIKCAVDDFGTGYSSLSYLKRFQLDAIKIDRSFVSRIESDSEDAAIVRAVSTLGQALGIEVTAEGIETAEQLANVRSLNCHLGQGYHFSRPIPAAEFSSILEANPNW